MLACRPTWSTPREVTDACPERAGHCAHDAGGWFVNVNNGGVLTPTPGAVSIDYIVVQTN
jgi:hypothetical protein